MSIHDEAAADVSDDATRATTEDDTILWGMGMAFGDTVNSSLASYKQQQRRSRHIAIPTFMHLPTWLQCCVLAALVLCLTLAVHWAQSSAQAISWHLSGVLKGSVGDSRSFQSRYFTTVPHMARWKRVVALVNGGMWLVSLVQLIFSFQAVLKGTLDNRTMQLRLLKTMFVWLAHSGIDGMLRLRTREEISISMMTILLLMLVLSTFAKNLVVERPRSALDI